MPTTSDLIDLLHERSEHPPAAPTLDGLHRRIGRRRIARATGVAAATLALAAVAMVPIAVTGGGTDRGSGGDPPGPYAGAMRLVASERAGVSAFAETTFSYTFTPRSYDFELGLRCEAGPVGRIEASINGRRVLSGRCAIDGSNPPFESAVHIDVPVADRHRWQEFGVVPNRPVNVVVTVRGGTEDQPAPLTAAGHATLLVYGPAPAAERPQPVRAPTGTTLINSVNALSVGANDLHPQLLSVRKVAGRHVTIIVETYGSGTVEVYANRVLQQTLEVPIGDATRMIVAVDPDKVAPEVPAGEWYTVGLVTRDFTAPLWRIIVLDTPPGRPLG